MPRCTVCGNAVRPVRGQIVDLRSNLGLYTDALIKAEKISVEIESAVAVIHWRLLKKFDVVLLDSYTSDMADYPLVHLMATVDHKGIITESGHAKAVKEVAA